MKKMELTMLIEKGENGFYVGQIQEYTEALSQGKTIEELKQNLIDALKLLLDYQKKTSTYSIWRTQNIKT